MLSGERQDIADLGSLCNIIYGNKCRVWEIWEIAVSRNSSKTRSLLGNGGVDVACR